MHWPHRPARWRFASVWVALSLVAIAAAMSVFALNQSDAATLTRSLVPPGGEVPDTRTYDAAAAGAGLEAAIALVLAAGVAFFPGRVAFAISTLWSLLAVGTGALIALGIEPPAPATVQVGPIELSMMTVGLALLLAAALCVAGCIVGWFGLPPEPRVVRPHMPPPTHQG
jgi:hypothetical protein